MNTYDFNVELANGDLIAYEGIFGYSYEDALEAVKEIAQNDDYDVLDVWHV